MGVYRFIIIALLLGLVPTLGGCAKDFEPYVYKPGEFNRESPNFAKEPSDIAQVVVCYGRLWSKPEEVSQVAEAECAKVGKKARFVRQGFDRCSLALPISAYYSCVAP